jgi:hypothetical protein
MRWIIKVTYQDDRAIPIAYESIINAEMLDDLPPNFRTSIFERMVRQLEDKLKEKNMKAEPTTKALIEMLYDRHPEIFHRPKRPWVGLTLEEVQDSYNPDYQAQTRAVEAKLKEKNT